MIMASVKDNDFCIEIHSSSNKILKKYSERISRLKIAQFWVLFRPKLSIYTERGIVLGNSLTSLLST